MPDRVTIEIALAAVSLVAAAAGLWAWRAHRRCHGLVAEVERFSAYARMSSHWYWEQDAQLRFTWLSGGVFEKGHARPEDFYGRTRWEMAVQAGSEDVQALLAEHRKVVDARECFEDFVYPVQSQVDGIRYFSITGEPFFDRSGQFKGYRGTARDVTERKLMEDLVQRMALCDGLTGLPNRTLFHDRIQQGLSQCRRDGTRLALLYLDLDRFKPVNDRLGHQVGDLLLKAVAARLEAMTRQSDTVARLGGDEFAVVLRDMPCRDTAEAVAHKIRDGMAQGFELEGVTETVFIGASLGLAMFPQDAGDREALIQVADRAMYADKRQKVATPLVSSSPRQPPGCGVDRSAAG